MDIKPPELTVDSRPLRTSADVAERLQVSPRTVESTSFLRRIGLRKLKIGRAVRFDPDDVEAAIIRARSPGCDDE